MSKAAKDNNSPHYMAKVAVVGAPKVGKSTLVQRFVSPDVEPKAKSVFNTKTVSIDGSSIQLQIWTAFAPNIYRWFQQQTDRFPVYYRGADAIIVVYDVTSIPSFDNAKVLRFRAFSTDFIYDDVANRVTSCCLDESLTYFSQQFF